MMNRDPRGRRTRGTTNTGAASGRSQPPAAGSPGADETGIPPIRRDILEWLQHAFLIAAAVAVIGFFLTSLWTAWVPPKFAAAIPFITTSTPQPTRTPNYTPTPILPLVGILAGHSGGADPGAICPDGLREVDVTTDVATRARTILEARGYRIDILAEFDTRLNSKRDYSPKVFLAIHADSCINYASGYKVARATASASPDEDDRLVRCVSYEYAASTQLPFHSGSITADMTQYHALNQIDPKTPGAIIELGFLGSDHDLLKSHRDILAEGVANGLDDFLNGEQCRKADASK